MMERSPYHAPNEERVYTLERKPFWVEHAWESSFSPVSSEVIERILPGTIRAGRARERLKKQIETLVVRNLENLRWETLQNIDTAFRQFSTDLDTSLALTIEATHGAVRSALAQRKQHGESVADRIVDLRKTSIEIQKVISRFDTVE